MDGQIIRMKSGLGEILIKIEMLLGFFFNLEEISPLFLKNLMPVFARGHACFSSTGKRAFARLIIIGQRAERALAFFQTGGQNRASGMPVRNTNIDYIV